MTNFPQKTSKWINEHLRREKSSTAKCDRQESHLKSTEMPLDAKYFNCTYCPKVFMDAKYLVKHTVRRHSDKLVILHKKLLELPKSDITPLSTDLLNFLKGEFANLKLELDVVKTALIEERKPSEETKIQKQQQINQRVSTETAESVSNQAYVNKSSNTAEQNVQVPLAAVQNLQAQVEKLFKLIKDTVTKSDIEQMIILNESKIYQQLKADLLHDFHTVLLSQQEENREMCKICLSDLKKELVRLEHKVENNSKEVHSSRYMDKILKELGEKIQMMLFPSMFDKRIKSTTPNQIQSAPVHGHLSSGSRLKRRRRTIFTNSFPTDTNKFPNSTVKNIAEISRVKKSGNLTTHLEDSENPTKRDFNGAKLMLEEKLKSLKISHQTRRISDLEFEKKMQLINKEKETLSKKYRHFNHIYNKTNSYADKLVKSKNKKMSRKLRFSDPPEVSPSVKEDASVKDSLFDVIQPSRKQLVQELGEPLECETDCFVQGDCEYVGNREFQKELLLKMQEKKDMFPRTSLGGGDNFNIPFISNYQQPEASGSYPTKDVDKHDSKTFTINETCYDKKVEDLSDLSSLESDPAGDLDT